MPGPLTKFTCAPDPTSSPKPARSSKHSCESRKAAAQSDPIPVPELPQFLLSLSAVDRRCCWPRPSLQPSRPVECASTLQLKDATDNSPCWCCKDSPAFPQLAHRPKARASPRQTGVQSPDCRRTEATLAARRSRLSKEHQWERALRSSFRRLPNVRPEKSSQ